MDITKIFLGFVLFTMLSLSIISPSSLFKTSYSTLFDQQIEQEAGQVAVGSDIA
jgi:hypothetical protein